MGRLLNIGYIAIIVSGAVRYIISKNHGVPFFETSLLQEWELWLYFGSAFWLILAIWNTFIRRRCPRCRSYKYSFISSEEVDRWVGSKPVREKVAKDTYATRHVPATFAKIKSNFRCQKCTNSWHETGNKEVK